MALADLGNEDLAAIEAGMANLRRHLDNIREVYGIPCVVAVNRFPSDTDAEIARVVDLVAAEGVRAFPATRFSDGGAGAHDLAKGVLQVLDEPSPYAFSFTYEDDQSLTEKVETIATRLYGAGMVTWAPQARRRLLRIERDGYGSLPVLRRQDAVLLLDDADLARRAQRSRAARARGQAVGRRGLRRRGLRRHDDHARAAERPVGLTHRPRRRRDHPRPVLSRCP